MELFEFMYKRKLAGYKIAKRIGVTANTIVALKTRKTSCPLMTALKLNRLSNGQITLEEMLSREKQIEFEKWILNGCTDE